MLSDLLKSTTAYAHKKLEGQFDLQTLSESSHNLSTYLQRFHAVVAPIESELLLFEDKLSELGLDLGPRLKSGILKEDLQKLGSEPQAHVLEFDVINSVYEALGVLYVLEGSTLGGQVITKALKKNNLEAKYFDPYGAQTISFWNSLKDVLNKVSSEHEEEVLTGALKAFDIFKDYIHTAPLN